MRHRAELRGVWKSYGRGDATSRALCGVDAVFHSGQLTLIVGPSGSGKTTLLQILGMLLPPDRGEVYLDGDRVDAMAAGAQVARRRSDVCFVFQEFNLIAALNVRDNVGLVATIMDTGRLQTNARVRHAVGAVNLSDVADKRPEQLSGGQRQRVGIARALASDGWLVMADEPTAAIDWESAEPIVKALARLAHEDGRCVIIVSHDPRLERYADRIIRLHEGTVAADEPINTAGGEGAPDAQGDVPSLPTQRRRARPSSRGPGISAAWLVIVALLGLLIGWVLPKGRPIDSATPNTEQALGIESGRANAPYADVVAAAPAVVEPWSKMVAIQAERPGRITAILKRAGESVAEGEPLVQLDDRTARSEVALTSAALTLREMELAKLKAWDRQEEREQAVARVAAAKARLDRAEREEARIERLREREAGTEDELHTALEETRIAKAAHDEALQRLAVSTAGPTKEQIAVAQALVAQAQAALDAARVELELRTIRSPLTGRVLYRHLEPGEVVDPEHPVPILSVGDVDRVRLRAEVDEADTGRVYEGQRVEATAAAYGGRRFSGKVVHLEAIMGRKNIRTERPTEQLDSKVLEVVIAMDPTGIDLPIDLQMTVRFLRDGAATRPGEE